MKNIKFVSKYLEGHRYKIIVMIVMMFGAVIVRLITPLLLSFLVDNIINLDPIMDPNLLYLSNLLGGVEYIRSNLWISALLFMLLSIVSGLMTFFRGVFNGSFSEYFSRNLRDDLYDHIQKQPFSYHVGVKSGDLIQRATSDVDQVYRFLSNQLPELVYAIFMVGFALIIMFNTDTTMTLYSIIVFPFIFIFAVFFFKKMQEAFRESDEAEAVLSSIFQESLDGVRVIKAFNKERYELDRFEAKNKDFTTKTIRVIHLLAYYWSISDFLCFSQILFVWIMSAFGVRNGTLSIGNAILFGSYISMILWPVRNLGRIISDMGKVSIAIERLEEVLDAPIEDLHTGLKPEIKGNIVFDNVSFKYDDSNEAVLKGISFDVKAGETIAIMGPTGSGKSSLVHLLTRLYDVTEGEILVEGVNILDIARSHMRNNVGVVLQEPFLYSKSILENIRISNAGLAEKEVYRAANIAHIHSDIESFDKGYDTLVGEKGVTLSGGQRQRIAIARALISDHPILIFDDSLSALDAKTDAQIRLELSKMDHSATTFIITHRINTAQSAGKIVVIDEGVIKQVGNHESLLAEEGLYKRIYNIQHQGGNINESTSI